MTWVYLANLIHNSLPGMSFSGFENSFISVCCTQVSLNTVINSNAELAEELWLKQTFPSTDFPVLLIEQTDQDKSVNRS